MVINPSTEEGIAFTFDGGGLEHRTLEVHAFTGTERISTPYRYEFTLHSRDLNLNPLTLLEKPALLRVKQRSATMEKGVITFKTHGVLTDFEYHGTLRNPDGTLAAAVYRAVLVPRLALLALTKQSRIFLNKTIQQIVEDVLLKIGLAASEYEFRLSAPYPALDFVLQYDETDLNFISRLLEHEGIYYTFEQDEEHEKVVFCDSPAGYGHMTSGDSFPWQPTRASETLPRNLFEEPVVQRLVSKHQRVPQRIILQDYNPLDPNLELETKDTVVSHGTGKVYEYGSHFKDPVDGKRLARVRAEELRSRENLFEGEGTVKVFRAGATFALTGHERATFNSRYLITEVVHRGEQALSFSGSTPPVPTYSNSFKAIPASLSFRPERVTPEPSVVGTMPAWIDASGDGKYAEINDRGEYKVTFALDRSGKSEGTGSCWIRMLQPYAGKGGFHFPLKKGTEVHVGFENGDPDRPIIVGALADPSDPNPVVGENQTQNVIRTGGGSELKIEDTEDSEYMHFKTPSGNTHFSIGSRHRANPLSLGGISMATNKAAEITSNRAINIASGAFGHEESLKRIQDGIHKIQDGLAILNTVIMVADLLNGAIATAGNSLIEAGRKAISEMLDGAPVNIFSPQTVTVSGVKGASLISDDTANIAGVVQTNVSSAASVAINAGVRAGMVGGVNVDISSGTDDLSIRSGTAELTGQPIVLPNKGNTNIEAFRDFLASANNDITIKAGTEDMNLKKLPTVGTLGNILIESLNPKDPKTDPTGKEVRLTLKVGDSTLEMSNEAIRLTAKRILLNAEDGKAVLDLGKQESPDAPQLLAYCEKKMSILSEKSIKTSAPEIELKGKDKMKLETDNLDATVKTEGKLSGGDLSMKAFKNVYLPSAHSQG